MILRYQQTHYCRYERHFECSFHNRNFLGQYSSIFHLALWYCWRYERLLNSFAKVWRIQSCISCQIRCIRNYRRLPLSAFFCLIQSVLIYDSCCICFALLKHSIWILIQDIRIQTNIILRFWYCWVSVIWWQYALQILSPNISHVSELFKWILCDCCNSR